MKLRLLMLVLTCFLAMASQCEKSEMMDMFCQEWEFVSSIDPYQGGTVTEADPTDKFYRTFEKDGTYREYEYVGRGEGRWAFNSDSTRVGTVLTIYNQQPTGDSPEISDFRWEIKELTPKKLVLSIQGRHGYVLYEYKAVEK
jgi:hypothetical protein